jgi:hypothetical protein
MFSGLISDKNGLFQFQFGKVTFVANLVPTRYKVQLLSVTGGGGFASSCKSMALIKISPSKNTLFSLYQRGQEVEKL